MSYDVIIIGSGAGGAPIAHTLVKAGKRVLMLEKGPRLLAQYQDPDGRSDFKRDELFATGAEKRIRVPGVANFDEAYFTSHVEPDLNDEPHVYRDGAGQDRVTIEGYTAQVVGGGTQLYGGVSLRFTPDDLKLQTFNAGRTDIADDPNGDVQREARDWPITYAALEPYYCKAEKLVGLNGTQAGQAKPFSQSDTYQAPLPPSGLSQYVERGMDALGMPRYRTPLAVITEDHAPSGRRAGDPRTSYVNRYGDPLGLKSSTWVSLLWPLRDEAGFELRCNCTVTRLESNGNRVTKVHYRDPAGQPQSAEAEVVVVACSAIESVRLLMLSGLEDANLGARIGASGVLGKYFLTHCFGGAETVVPERFDKSRSLDSDWATDHCAAAAYVRANGLWAGGAIYNNTSDQALPLALARTHGSQDLDTIWDAFEADDGLRGAGLLAWLDESFGRRLSVSFMANMVPLPTNRIELHPTITDKWGRRVAYVIKDWHAHDRHVMRRLADQCAAILEAGGANAAVRIERGGVFLAPNGVARIANHILGGARFGADPTDSVLDPSCRAWELDNLYITDGSFMPTSGSANPTLTIQANAFRVADAILGRR